MFFLRENATDVLPETCRGKDSGWTRFWGVSEMYEISDAPPFEQNDLNFIRGCFVPVSRSVFQGRRGAGGV
jgi:hypothetical protein